MSEVAKSQKLQRQYFMREDLHGNRCADSTQAVANQENPTMLWQRSHEFDQRLTVVGEGMDLFYLLRAGVYARCRYV